MASSPTDPSSAPPTDPGGLLQQIAAAYDAAVAALARADLDGVDARMDEAELLRQELGDARGFQHDPALAAVTHSHGRLLTALQATHAGIRASIHKAQKGRKALHGYGNRSVQTGTRLESLS
jgi:hypothetical protein